VKILVTCGAGFIGLRLTDALLTAVHKVTSVDSRSEQIHGNNPNLDLLHDQVGRGMHFERGGVRDDTLMGQLIAHSEGIIYLTAETGTGQSMDQISHCYDVDVPATARAFATIGKKHRHVRQLVVVSSCSMYGQGAYRNDDRLFDLELRDPKRLAEGHWEPIGSGDEQLTLISTLEEAPVTPASIDAETKLAKQQLGEALAEAYGVSVTAPRFQNVYGQRQSLLNPRTGIPSDFPNRMQQDVSINIFEDDSEVEDAILQAIERAPTGYKVLNIGAGALNTVMNVAHSLASVLNSSSALQERGDFRAGDTRHRLAGLGLPKKQLGFAPKESLEEGLAAFCDWGITQQVADEYVASHGSGAAAHEHFERAKLDGARSEQQVSA
jgi:dTDP-L-rhamnose 4-epimerase